MIPDRNNDLTRRLLGANEDGKIVETKKSDADATVSEVGGSDETKTSNDDIAIWSLDYDGCLAGDGALVAIYRALDNLAVKNGWDESAALCKEELSQLGDDDGGDETKTSNDGPISCSDFVKLYIQKLSDKSDGEEIKDQIQNQILEAMYQHHEDTLFRKIPLNDTVMSGSNRQSKFHDIYNTTKMGGGKMPLSLPFFRFLRDQKKHSVSLLRLEDLPVQDNTSDKNKIRDVATNDSAPHTLEIFPDKEKLTRLSAKQAYFDNSKVALLYFQMHQQAANNLGSNNINFHFVDDKENILTNLHQFFSDRPDLIPARVTLHLYQYVDTEKREPDQIRSEIIGTGNRDNDYKVTLIRLFENTKRVTEHNPEIPSLPQEQHLDKIDSNNMTDKETCKWGSLFLLELSLYNKDCTINMPQKEFVDTCIVLYGLAQKTQKEQKEQAKFVAKCIEVAHYHTKDPQANDQFPQDAVNAISEDKELKAMYDHIIGKFIGDHNNPDIDAHPIYQHTSAILKNPTASFDDKVTAMRAVKEYRSSNNNPNFKYSKGLKKKINTKAKRSKSWWAVNIALGLLVVATVALVVLSHGLATPLVVAGLKLNTPIVAVAVGLTAGSAVARAHSLFNSGVHPSPKEKRSKDFSSIEKAISSDQQSFAASARQ